MAYQVTEKKMIRLIKAIDKIGEENLLPNCQARTELIYALSDVRDELPKIPDALEGL